MLHEIVNYISNLPPSTWTTLVSYLGGSTAVAGVLQVTKHKFNFADAEKLVVLALGLLSFFAAFADFLLQNSPTLNALPWLGHVTGLLMAGAVVMHRFFVSPAYYSLAAKLKRFSILLKEAEAEQTPSAASAIPATVVTTPAPASASGIVSRTTVPDEGNLTQFQV